MALYTAKNARRALVDTVTFRVISQVATVIGFIVLVRSMPEEDFGVLNLLYAFIPVISTVASLGLEQTLRRYQPEYLAAGDTPAARWLVRFVASARFGTNVMLLALILLAWNTAAPIFKLTPYRGEFAFFCLLVLLHFQARILQLSLGANMLHRFSVGSMAVLSMAKLAGYSAIALQGVLTLPKAIIVDTIAFALTYLVLLLAYRKHCPTPPGSGFRPARSEVKRLFRYGLLNNFNDAGTMVLGAKSDNFFIAAFMDPVAVAVYAFYNRLNEMLGRLQPQRVFDNVIQPLFFAVPPAEADQRIPRYFSLLLNTTLLMQLPILAFSIAYHQELVLVVFGAKFVEHSVLFPMIVGFATLKTIATPVTLVAQYEERAGIILASKVFAIYNVVALLVLIPLMGLYGAVIATGSAALFKNLFIWWFARRRARWTNGVAAVVSIVLVWGTITVVCVLSKSILPDAPVLDLLFGSIACGVGFLIFSRTPILSMSDRSILANVLKGKESSILRVVGLIQPKPPPRT